MRTLEVYIFRRGRMADAVLEALRERGQSGIRVRVIVDAIGSLATRPAFFEGLMASAPASHLLLGDLAGVGKSIA